jgi:hypothetical protein
LRFGDSKVVDEAGRPLVVYHGTGADFERLSTRVFAYSGEGASQTGSGFYFTTSADSASRYASLADTKGQAGRILPVFLSIKKPLHIDFAIGETTGADITLSAAQVRKIILKAPNIRSLEESPLLNFGDVGYEGFEKVLREAVNAYAGGNNIAALRNDFFGDNHSLWLRAFSEVTGYDGAYAKTTNGDTHYVAWFPEQIKSATGNRGTFDPTSPDITKSTDRSSYLGPLDAAQEAAAKNIGAIKAPMTAQQRMAQLRANLGLRVRQGLVDQFAAIREVTQEGYIQARMSKNDAGPLEAMFLYGKPFMRDGVYDVKVTQGRWVREGPGRPEGRA